MVATLKTTNIQEPSSSTVNLTLDTSGGVAIGQNLSVSGTATLSGGVASSGLPLKGSSSGTTTLVAASTASGTVTIPAGTGIAAVQGVSTNIVSGTAVTASGTAVSFTGIPSWAKRITMIVSGVVAAGGSSAPITQLGTSGGFVTTGYVGGIGAAASGNSTLGGNFSVGFGNSFTTANTFYGTYVFVNITGNVWVATFTGGMSNATFGISAGGSVTLGSALTQVRLTSVNGTDSFSGGSVNILYE
jgi:hypothetical protein